MKQYFFLDAQNQQRGPYEADRLQGYGVTAETLVWAEGMAEWQTAGSVPELAAFFQTQPQYRQAAQPQQVAPQYAAAQESTGGAKPSSYLLGAILSMLCCNPILGAVALAFALQVGRFNNYNMLTDSRRASAKAYGWAMAAFITGIIIIVIYLVAVLIGFGLFSSDILDIIKYV